MSWPIRSTIRFNGSATRSTPVSCPPLNSMRAPGGSTGPVCWLLSRSSLSLLVGGFGCRFHNPFPLVGLPVFSDFLRGSVPVLQRHGFRYMEIGVMLQQNPHGVAHVLDHVVVVLVNHS